MAKLQEDVKVLDTERDMLCLPSPGLDTNVEQSSGVPMPGRKTDRHCTLDLMRFLPPLAITITISYTQ